jgi:predicted amidohydrolase YtcJ
VPLNADVVVVNASIVTMDPDLPLASAMAVAGGRVVAIGDASDVRHFRGPLTDVRDLTGSTVTPGLIDAHLRPFLASLPRDDTAGRLREVLRGLARTGVTGATVMDGVPADFLLYDEADAAERGLPVRIVAALTRSAEEDEVRHHVALRDAGGDRWRGGVIALAADDDERGHDDPGHGGLDLRAVERYAAEGFQLATRATGGQVGGTIDAYVRAGIRSRSGASHRIEGLGSVSDADLARIAALGVPVSIRSASASGGARSADALAAGVSLALGSDAPLAEVDARAGMAWARGVRAPGIRDAAVTQHEQRLSALQALHASTVGAARAQGDGDELGMLSEGFAGDFVVWPEDPTRVTADDLVRMPVSETWLEGRLVYSGNG